MELSKNKLSVKVGKLGLNLIINLFFFIFYGASICGCHFSIEAAILSSLIISFNTFTFIKELKKGNFKIISLLFALLWLGLEIMANSKNLLN